MVRDRLGERARSVGVPVFENDFGDVSVDPLTLLPTQVTPAVRLDRLAACFVPPVLRRNFLPTTPWHGVERVWYEPSPSPPEPAEDVNRRFADAIRSTMTNAETVAVAVSGGIDSLAVLVTAAAIAREDARRCVAVTVDRLSDFGTRTAELVARLIRGLEIDCEHQVVETVPRSPPWWPAGPRMDLEPHVECATAAAAENIGADVLLSGEGADQVLGAVLSLSRDLPRGRRVGAAYAWRTWKQFPFDARLSPLTQRYAEAATSWLDEFALLRARAHRTAARTPRQASSVDAVACFNTFPPSAGVPEAQPFLDPVFVRYALAVPLEQRFDRSLGPYFASKALVMRLLPPLVKHLLPARRETTFQEFSAFWSMQDVDAQSLKEAELIDPTWHSDRDSPFIAACVAAANGWLEGALARGAQIHA